MALLHLPPLVLAGAGQVAMLATLVIPEGLRRNAMIALVLPLPVAGRAAMIVVGQRPRAVGVPIGHAAMIAAMTKLVLRRTPIGRRGSSTVLVLFAN